MFVASELFAVGFPSHVRKFTLKRLTCANVGLPTETLYFVMVIFKNVVKLHIWRGAQIYLDQKHLRLGYVIGT